MPPWLIFVIIGILGGISAGFFGIGGGIIPALIYWAGFSQHLATGTTLAVLFPPIGLAAAFEYYRHGNVDVNTMITRMTIVSVKSPTKPETMQAKIST
ncbi:MAG: TSUP family transporter, partial [Methylobacter sp.]